MQLIDKYIFGLFESPVNLNYQVVLTETTISEPCLFKLCQEAAGLIIAKSDEHGGNRRN